ncbi:MAG: nucleotide sugar dehydrogenase [Chloroflexi bacterium]|nr:nucleotide sugar dehydrogenase [Chloroflexota bacterium]
MTTDYRQQVLNRLADKTATIGVIGLGYVGLPLAVAFAEAGYHVIGVDTDETKVKHLNQGQSYVIDIPSEQIAPLVDNGSFRATTDYEALRKADAVSICVPTPLRKTKDPDMSFILQAIEGLSTVSHAGMLVSLESTTYPGTTEEIIAEQLSEQGLVIGQDAFVTFSPERIDPANKIYTVRNIPRVVGGVTPACLEVGVAYYSIVVEEVVPVNSPTTAEMVKLLENTFRAVNIALANEIAMMCDRLGIDVWEVIQAAATKPFGFMPHYPGPGLGGHCIPLDPHYLSWKLKTLNYTARFIELASEINTNMPFYVLDKIVGALNEIGKPVRQSRIGILGVAYKRDVDDVRESPALDIIHILAEKGAVVEWADPHVKQVRLIDGTLSHPAALTADWLQQQDCIVVITDHSTFDWDLIVSNAGLIVDTRNATRMANATVKAQIVGLSPTANVAGH